MKINDINKFKKIFLIVLMALFINRCATSNYYTAKTLKPDESAMNPGLDNLFLYDTDEGDHAFSFTPSLGYIHGLPWRFETGAKIYFPYALEVMLRNQLTPRSFNSFDLSANLHYGLRYFIGKDEIDVWDQYLKYGMTISKEIAWIQPFLSYYRFIPLTRDRYFLDSDKDYYIDSNFSAGLAIFSDKDYLVIPEINYQLTNSDFSEGLLYFGIGLRVSM